MSVMQDLLDLRLNAFGFQLAAESILKSPVAPMSEEKELRFFFPINREDCADWEGVEIAFKAVRKSGIDAAIAKGTAA